MGMRDSTERPNIDASIVSDTAKLPKTEACHVAYRKSMVAFPFKPRFLTK